MAVVEGIDLDRDRNPLGEAKAAKMRDNDGFDGGAVTELVFEGGKVFAVRDDNDEFGVAKGAACKQLVADIGACFSARLSVPAKQLFKRFGKEKCVGCQRPGGVANADIVLMLASVKSRDDGDMQIFLARDRNEVVVGVNVVHRMDSHFENGSLILSQNP